MEKEEILEQIVELCHEINDNRLSSAIEFDIDEFREDSLDETFVILDELKGEDSDIDYLIQEIEDLHKKLCDL